MIRRVLRLYRDAFSGLNRDVWVACAALLVNRAGWMVLPFVSLYLTSERGLTIATAGRLLAVYGLGSIGGAWLGGWLSDRIGAVRAQQISLISTGFVLLGFLWARGVAVIAVALLLLSVVSESFRPAVMATVSERAPADMQPKAFALLRLGANLGVGIGPAVGGWLALYSYGSLFVVDAVTCWLAAGVLFALLPSARPEDDDAASDAPAPARTPWRDGPFLLLLVLAAGMAVVIFQVFSTLPVYLRQVYGLRENGIGMLLGLNAALIVVFEMVLIHGVRRWRPLRVAGVGAFLLCAGFGLMPLGATIPWAMLTVLVWTVGEMLSLPMMNVVVAGRASRRSRGSYMGLYTMAFAVAFVLAPIAGTWIFERFGADRLWYAVGALGPLLWIGSLGLERAFRSTRTAP